MFNWLSSTMLSLTSIDDDDNVEFGTRALVDSSPRITNDDDGDDDDDDDDDNDGEEISFDKEYNADKANEDESEDRDAVIVEADDAFDDGGGDAINSSFASLFECDLNSNEFANDIEWLLSLVTAFEKLMIRQLGVPERAIVELRRIIRRIGKDADVTALYETVTSTKYWRLAITMYPKIQIESTLFGTMRYRLTCPLDRLVYTLLANQSLTLAYSTYRRVLTTDRMQRALSYIAVIERFRRHLNPRDGTAHDAAMRESIVRVVQFLRRNAFLLAYEFAVGTLHSIEPRTIARTGCIFGQTIARSAKRLALTIEQIQRIMTLASATTMECETAAATAAAVVAATSATAAAAAATSAATSTIITNPDVTISRRNTTESIDKTMRGDSVEVTKLEAVPSLAMVSSNSPMRNNDTERQRRRRLRRRQQGAAERKRTHDNKPENYERYVVSYTADKRARRNSCE